MIDADEIIEFREEFMKRNESVTALLDSDLGFCLEIDELHREFFNEVWERLRKAQKMASSYENRNKPEKPYKILKHNEILF